MAEGMVSVGFLPAQKKACQRHDGGRGVGEVVHSVGHNGDGPGDETRQQLDKKEQEIQNDANRAAENAVALTQGGFGTALGLQEQPGMESAPKG